jgi:hypothetical protein
MVKTTTTLQQVILLNMIKFHKKQLLVGLINELYTGNADSDEDFPVNQRDQKR